MLHIVKYLLISLIVGFASCFGYSETIILPNQTVYITQPIIITNSNTTIIGQSNTVLKLKNGANCPIIIIGTLNSFSISNINLFNINIDGNKTNQFSESWKITSDGVINNNGITIQNSQNITIFNVKIENCRSGGLVTTFNVNHLYVSNLESSCNSFDGYAGYETQNSIFINLNLHNNLAAGISVDNSFNNNTFINCKIGNNNSVIFMRHSNNNLFFNISCQKNVNGIFIAQENDLTNTAACNNSFKNIEIDNTKPLIVNNNSCTNNIFQKSP